MRTWQSWEKAAQKGPGRLFPKILMAGCLVVVVLSVVGVGLSFFGFFTGAATNAVSVAKKEFYPDALLKKYEWFKNASAQLDKKVADISVYEGRFIDMEDVYDGVPRREWPRSDREQYNLWRTEAAGIKASYNLLAAEYNAQMVKFNWRFTNVGDLPPGAETPLPREHKPYITQ
jgi:hypothetical protein